MLQVERFLWQSRTLLRLVAVFGNKVERVFVSFRQNRPNQTCSIFVNKSNDRATSCCRSSGVDDLVESRMSPMVPMSTDLLWNSQQILHVGIGIALKNNKNCTFTSSAVVKKTFLQQLKDCQQWKTNNYSYVDFNRDTTKSLFEQGVNMWFVQYVKIIKI